MFVLILNRHFILYTTTPRLNNSTAPFADGLDLVQGGVNNRRWGLIVAAERDTAHPPAHAPIPAKVQYVHHVPCTLRCDPPASVSSFSFTKAKC